MHKDYSLFTNGMKVVIFSYQRWQREQVEWHHAGISFTYRKNEIVKVTVC
jgi:aspartate 1-decarboxylase